MIAIGEKLSTSIKNVGYLFIISTILLIVKYEFVGINSSIWIWN